MTITTRATRHDAQRIVDDLNMFARIESEHGLTIIHTSERCYGPLAIELDREGFAFWAGRPRSAASAPRTFASASAHIRRR